MLIGQAEADKLVFRPEAVDAAALAERLARESERALARRCEVRLTHHGLDGRRMLDAALVSHAVGNLLTNAIKYSPPGAVVELRVEAAPGTLAFVVADRGIGIPREDQARLFDSFHRARNVGNIEGTGLGLAIVKQSVELQGGSVEFESEIGRGSTFTIRLPAPSA
jgi:signal transduction histidine kinase